MELNKKLFRKKENELLSKYLKELLELIDIDNKEMLERKDIIQYFFLPTTDFEIRRAFYSKTKQYLKCHNLFMTTNKKYWLNE